MKLEQDFTKFLLELADRTKKETHGNYNPTAFRGMVANDGGVETARKLINTSQPSEGYITLATLNPSRLDLTLEAQILENKKYHSLFTEKELKTCQNRLKDYKYEKIFDL